MSEPVVIQSLSPEQIAQLMVRHGEAPSLSVARRLIGMGVVDGRDIENLLIKERLTLVEPPGAT